MKKLFYVVFILFLASFATAAQIKLSNSGICHDPSSSSYNRTKNFTAYSTLESCLNEGGRLPKGSNPTEKKINSNSKYERKLFGHGWNDADNDCQNTRHEILIKQSVGNVTYTNSSKCSVKTGKWNSLFTGKTYYSSKELDIDHIVPLKFAWTHGANKWSDKKRETFANDPINLVAVEASLNRQKGAKGITNWLPPTNQCQYINRFIRIAKEYDLKFSNSEKKKFESVKLAHCSK